MFSLKNKTVFLTGSTGGIGKEIAFQMSSLGAKLLLTGTNEEKLKDLSSKLPNQNDYIVSNLDDSQNVENLSNQLIEKGYSIDILINNAGITKDGLILRMKEDEWSSVMNINLHSTVFLTQKIIKGMIKRRYGRIINITSVIGVAGGAGQSNYSASKAGIIAMSKSLAQEVGSRSVTVNSIAPGFIETNMTAELSDDRKQEILNSISIARLGKPDDIAGAVCFLASDKASYITGQTIHINGGMLMI